MKKTILFLTLVFPLFSSAKTVLLECHKKDFFYYDEGFYLTLANYDGELVIRYTYSHGTASASVNKISDYKYAGSSPYIKADLTWIKDNKYSFTAIDLYDGLMSVGPIEVSCE